MKIDINNKRKIFAVQSEFSEMYPGLKIVFYAKPNKSGGAASTKIITHSSKTLEDCRAISNEGTIEIMPSMKISDLKDNFRDIFGLSIEILQNNQAGPNINLISDNITLEEIGRVSSV